MVGGTCGADFPRGFLLFEGGFGRIFRALPAAQFSNQDLESLAREMTALPELDSTSQAPSWKAEPAFTANGKFGMAELIKAAMKA